MVTRQAIKKMVAKEFYHFCTKARTAVCLILCKSAPMPLQWLPNLYDPHNTHTQRLQTRKHFQPKKKGSAQIPDSYFYPYKKYLQHAATKSSQILRNQELQ
jgi:hypothetical protein